MSKRDDQFRLSILTHARLQAAKKPDGWATASAVMLAVRDFDGRTLSEIGNEEFVTELFGVYLNELIELALLAEKEPEPTGKLAARDMSYRKIKITDKAFKLIVTEEIDPIPGIATRSDD